MIVRYLLNVSPIGWGVLDEGLTWGVKKKYGGGVDGEGTSQTFQGKGSLNL